MNFEIGSIVTGTTSLPWGGEIKVTGPIAAVVHDGRGRLDTVIIRPGAESQAKHGLTDQGIGYRPEQIEAA